MFLVVLFSVRNRSRADPEIGVPLVSVSERGEITPTGGGRKEGV
jgi:hypothetical protein